MLDLLERHGHLALTAETGDRRYCTGAYRARLHVRALLDWPAGRSRPDDREFDRTGPYARRGRRRSDPGVPDWIRRSPAI
jgi:hypothetical protein